MKVIFRRPIIRAIAALTLVTAVSAIWLFNVRIDTKELRAELKRQYSRGNYSEASRLCSQILSAEPDAHDIRLTAAQCAAADNSPQQALEQLEQITSSDPDLQLQVLLLQSQLLHQSLFRLSDAEAAYRAALAISPHHTEALNGLAQLLAACGRRREALPFLFELIRQGEVSDLLIVAARSSGAINNVDLLHESIRATPGDPCALLGLAMHAHQAGDTETSIRYCRQAIAANRNLTIAQVALGQYLVDAGRFEELEEWYSELKKDAETFAETWEVAGQLFEYQQEPARAIEAYQRAVKLGPDLKTSLYRLSVLCRQSDDSASADHFLERLNQLRELELLQDRMFASGPEDLPTMLSAIRSFEQSGRIWEALGWAAIGLSHHGHDSELRTLQSRLSEQADTLPLTLYDGDAVPNLDVRIVSTLQSQGPQNVAVPPTGRSDKPDGNEQPEPSMGVAFRNDAADCGLHFRFLNGVAGPTTHRMFEFTGGGAGIIDIDADDYPDVFLTQGGYWPTEAREPDACDALFRNQQGKKFEPVTEAAGIEDQQFGQGVAVGDVNNDGFADIVVANIGTNRLWLNCGDGTFTGYWLSAKKQGSEGDISESSSAIPSIAGRIEQDSDIEDEWSSSVAIADLNRDGAADIYVVNYLSGPDLFSRICPTASGRAQACVPVQFDAAADQLWLNQNNGEFEDASGAMSDIPAGKGLGILIMSPRCDGRPTAYLANDTTANMLLSFDSISEGRIHDTAIEKGIAFNRVGKAEGSMGIAAADLNADGLPELFVTNFFNESNTLYQQTAGGYFEDRTREWNLVDCSLPFLGFGTQFIDADGDAVPELFVANGHVDDLRHAGKPYHMRAQFLSLKGEHFQEVPASLAGPYFQEEHLGRAAAVIDWNRDLRPDLLVGHLNENYALLTNTGGDAQQTLSLRLTGVTSERDGHLTTVSYSAGGQRVIQQLMSGDGYFCSNQKQLLLSGVSGTELLDLHIRWPSGEEQTLHGLRPGRRYAIVEQRNLLLTLPD